jgi:hypothetical protein
VGNTEGIMKLGISIISFQQPLFKYEGLRVCEEINSGTGSSITNGDKLSILDQKVNIDFCNRECGTRRRPDPEAMTG